MRKILEQMKQWKITNGDYSQVWMVLIEHLLDKLHNVMAHQNSAIINGSTISGVCCIDSGWVTVNCLHPLLLTRATLTDLSNVNGLTLLGLILFRYIISQIQWSVRGACTSWFFNQDPPTPCTVQSKSVEHVLYIPHFRSSIMFIFLFCLYPY